MGMTEEEYWSGMHPLEDMQSDAMGSRVQPVQVTQVMLA